MGEVVEIIKSGRVFLFSFFFFLCGVGWLEPTIFL